MSRKSVRRGELKGVFSPRVPLLYTIGTGSGRGMGSSGRGGVNRIEWRENAFADRRQPGRTGEKKDRGRVTDRRHQRPPPIVHQVGSQTGAAQNIDSLSTFNTESSLGSKLICSLSVARRLKHVATYAQAYDRATKLGLNPQPLPYWISLCSNDQISYLLVGPFYLR